MSPHFPSIKDFFQQDLDASPTKKRPRLPVPDSSLASGDGFMDQERQISLDSSSDPEGWNRAGDYTSSSIGDLVCGPQKTTFTARVVHLYLTMLTSKSPKAARGCWHLVVKDDTGTVAVCDSGE